MKKMFRLISAVLCVAMLLGSFSLQGFAVARVNTVELIHLYGDIDGDGVIEQSDYEYILAVATGEQAMPAVGTPEYYAADIMGDGITMEDARRCYRYLNGMDDINSYSPAEREAALFNDLVNIIKTDGFEDNETMTYYTYDYEHMETNNFEFDNDIAGLLEDMFKEEIEDVESYSALRKNYQLYSFESETGCVCNYPASDRAVVTSLTADDIKNMTIEVGVPCTFSADVGAPASYMVGSREYDLSELTAQEAQYTDCIKVKVEIKDESYKKDVANRPEGVNTALYNLYGLDIAPMGEEFPLVEDASELGLTMRMVADLDDINTSAWVIYYFDRETLNPMAAGYYIEVDAKQLVQIELEAGIVSIKGSMDPRTVLVTKQNYWFGSFFEVD